MSKKLIFSRGHNAGYRSFDAATIQAGMNSMKYRPADSGTFLNPFGKKGQCEIHRGGTKTAVNGVCQACSSRWNAKKVTDFLDDQRIKQWVSKHDANLRWQRIKRWIPKITG